MGQLGSVCVKIELKALPLGNLFRAEGFVELLHEGVPQCPTCGEPMFSGSIPSGWVDGKWIRCQKCQKKANWRSNTLFAGSTLTPGQAAALLLGVQLGVETSVLSFWTGLSESSVRGWKRKFRVLEAI